MTVIEWIAAALGLTCVALAVRRSIWNYAFGIASTALYAIVFHDARLYSDALLQLFFVAVNAYGWRNWHRSRAESGTVVVEVMGGQARAMGVVSCVVLALVWGGVMHRFTDAAYPWPDAGIAVTSIVAQVLMARRYWENWVLWIAVDAAAMPVFAARGLWVTTALYAVFLMLAVAGLFEWRRARRLQPGMTTA